MPHETRINLKRLLEDIRDSYPSPVEEVIITELVANALDSGATEIRFSLDSTGGILSCIDNGRGMTRQQLRACGNSYNQQGGFLSDQASLKKYYRYRKAAQEALIRLLPAYGESFGTSKGQKPSREVRELSREIEYTLEQLSQSFPELLHFVGVRKKRVEVSAEVGIITSASAVREREHGIGDAEQMPAADAVHVESASAYPPGGAEIGVKGNEGEESLGLTTSEGGSLRSRVSKKRPGLKIDFQEFEDTGSLFALGRLVDDSVFVNTAHPAWKKAKESQLEEYHILTTVALVLSEFIQPERSTQDFISLFLAQWGQPDKGKQGILL